MSKTPDHFLQIARKILKNISFSSLVKLILAELKIIPYGKLMMLSALGPDGALLDFYQLIS